MVFDHGTMDPAEQVTRGSPQTDGIFHDGFPSSVAIEAVGISIDTFIKRVY